MAEKSARLAELDAALNMDSPSVNAEDITEPGKRPSVLADLKSKNAVFTTNSKRHSQREEVL